VKYSRAERHPFGKMKVKLKREIVTMNAGELDPARNAGLYVEPQDWNALIEDPDTILIDTRNDYEVAVGTFAGAKDPKHPHLQRFSGLVRTGKGGLGGGRAGGTEGGDVLYRRHTLREIDRVRARARAGAGVPPERGYPQISGRNPAGSKPLARQLLCVR
jgi:hypothetical protein